MATDPKNELHRKKWLDAYGRYAGLGFQMAITLFAGVAAGRWLDTRFQFDPPFMTLLGALAGLAAAMYVLIKTTRKP